MIDLESERRYSEWSLGSPEPGKTSCLHGYVRDASSLVAPNDFLQNLCALHSLCKVHHHLAISNGIMKDVIGGVDGESRIQAPSAASFRTIDNGQIESSGSQCREVVTNDPAFITGRARQ